MLVIHGG
jgi:prenyltransferase beta subunit